MENAGFLLLFGAITLWLYATGRFAQIINVIRSGSITGGNNPTPPGSQPQQHLNF